MRTFIELSSKERHLLDFFQFDLKDGESLSKGMLLAKL